MCKVEFVFIFMARPVGRVHFICIFGAFFEI